MQQDAPLPSNRLGRRQFVALAAASLLSFGIETRATAHDETPTPTATPVFSAAGSPDASPVGSPMASPVIAGQIFDSTIQGLKFLPPEIHIDAGTTVVWTNKDVVAHTVTHKVKVEDQLFASPFLVPGDSFAYTFTKPGIYPIYCLPHPFMTQTVVVS